MGQQNTLLFPLIFLRTITAQKALLTNFLTVHGHFIEYQNEPSYLGDIKVNARFSLLGLLILAILLSSAALASKLYVDDQGRFSFSFKGDWRKLEETAEGVDGHFVLARGGKAVAEVIITHEAPEKKMTLDEYVKMEKSLIEKQEGYTRINEETGFKIGGYPATWILVNLTEKDVSGHTSIKKLSQYFIKKGDVFWGITAIVSEEDRDLIPMIQKTIAKSFEFGTGGKVSLRPLVQEEIKIVIDPAQRYSIRVPESWKIIPTDGLDLEIESDIGKMHVFSLALKGQDKKLTAKEIVNNFIVEYEILEKCHVINEAPVRIGTQKGHMINYRGEESGYAFHVQLIVLPRDDIAFYTYFISSPKKWDENQGRIDAVQHTFSFIGRKVDVACKDRLPEFLQKTAEAEADVGEKETAITRTREELWDISGKLLWEPLSKDNIPK